MEDEGTAVPFCPCEAGSKSENKRMNIIILTSIIYIFQEKNIAYRKEIVKLTVENQQLKYGSPCPDSPSVSSRIVELVEGSGVYVNREILKRLTIHK